MSKIVEFTVEELTERLWFFDVVGISKKIIDTCKYSVATEINMFNLAAKVEHEVELIMDKYYEMDFLNLVDAACVERLLDYIYSGVINESQVSVEEVYGIIKRINDNDEFDPVGVAYQDACEMKEDFYIYESVVESFTDECSSEYKIVFGDSEVKSKESYFYQHSFHVYVVKDEVVLNYLKGEKDRELVVKYLLQSIFTGMDECISQYVMIGWKIKDGQIDVLVKCVYNNMDPFNVEQMFQIYMERAIINIVMKKAMEVQVNVEESLYVRN